MTILLTDAPTLQPQFGDCPPWCSRRGLHEPGDEHDPRGGLMPRLHEAELLNTRAAVPLHVQPAHVQVTVSQFVWGSHDPTEVEADPAQIEVLIVEHAGASIVLRPDATQARRIADALYAAADLLEGGAR